MSDAAEAQDTVLTETLQRMVEAREFPKTVCPSEIARALPRDCLERLNCSDWRDAMPAVRTLAWEMRQSGEIEILQKGQPLDVLSLAEIRGPIRLRIRKAENSL